LSPSQADNERYPITATSHTQRDAKPGQHTQRDPKPGQQPSRLVGRLAFRCSRSTSKRQVADVERCIGFGIVRSQRSTRLCSVRSYFMCVPFPDADQRRSDTAALSPRRQPLRRSRRLMMARARGDLHGVASTFWPMSCRAGKSPMATRPLRRSRGELRRAAGA
jgi:hypothetical protein